MRAKLYTFVWGHAILHAISLVRIMSVAYHKYLSLQLAYGHELNISHLRIFGCVVNVLIASPKHTKMGP